MATVGFSAAGIANEPVSWLRKLSAMAVPFTSRSTGARSETPIAGRDDATPFEVSPTKQKARQPAMTTIDSGGQACSLAHPNHSQMRPPLDSALNEAPRTRHSRDQVGRVDWSKEEKLVDSQSPFGSRLSMPRRRFLKSAAAVGVVGAFPVIITRQARAEGNPTVVNSIRSLSNPYHATWNKGGAAFAKSIGVDYVTLVTEGNSEKGIADIRAIIQKTGGNMVLNVDPNDAPDGRPIVDASTKAGVYVTTQWTRPADLHPWDCNPYYVSYITFDNLKYGEATADALIKPSEDPVASSLSAVFSQAMRKPDGE